MHRLKASRVSKSSFGHSAAKTQNPLILAFLPSLLLPLSPPPADFFAPADSPTQDGLSSSNDKEEADQLQSALLTGDLRKAFDLVNEKPLFLVEQIDPLKVFEHISKMEPGSETKPGNNFLHGLGLLHDYFQTPKGKKEKSKILKQVKKDKNPMALKAITQVEWLLKSNKKEKVLPLEDKRLTELNDYIYFGQFDKALEKLEAMPELKSALDADAVLRYIGDHGTKIPNYEKALSVLQLFLDSLEKKRQTLMIGWWNTDAETNKHKFDALKDLLAKRSTAERTGVEKI